MVDSRFELVGRNVRSAYNRIECDIYSQGFSEATIKQLQKAVYFLQKTEIYVHRIDRLLNGVDSEQKYLDKLIQDIKALRKKRKEQKEKIKL